MIVIEGPDGSGKTTLAQQLAAEFPISYERAPHLSSQTGPSGVELVDWWEKQLKLKKKDKIYDRTFYISEPIYQLAQPDRKLLVDSKRFYTGWFKFVNRIDLLIFCQPSWPVARQVLEDEGRLSLEGVNLNQLEKIHWLYDVISCHYMEILFERVTLYDYTNMTLDHIREAVSEIVGPAVAAQ